MATDPNQPVVLTTTRSELEAATLVSALDGRGIQAQYVGGLTSGFRAEAPGEVTVIVRAADLERARAALVEIRDDALAGEDWQAGRVDSDETDELSGDGPGAPEGF